MKVLIISFSALLLSFFLNTMAHCCLRASDTLTVSSSYFESQYTNSQLSVFGLELLRAGSRFEDFAVEKASTENVVYATYFSRILIYWLYYGFSVAYHEIGHGLRAKAYGCDYMLKRHSDGRSFRKNEHFFKYFAKRLVSVKRGACAYEYKQLTDKEQLVICAGGINNETYFAERISDELFTKGSIGATESVAYFHNRISPIIYAARSKRKDNAYENIKSSDDPVSIEGYYKRLGIKANKNNAVSAGLISMLLSGTTYSIVRGVFLSDRYCTAPLEFAGIRIPDTYTYLTSKGISYKIISGYRMRGLNVIFGAERVFNGKSETEFTFGVDKALEAYGNVSYKIVSIFGKQFSLEASCGVSVFNNLLLNFGGGSYSCGSLYGERHARNMKNNKGRSNNIFVSLSYIY